MASAPPPRLVLGSGSPRRLELLAQIGVKPDEIRSPDIDETPASGELPRPYCERMAREKSLALPLASDEILLTADTTVSVGRRILGKPADADEARRYLRLMSGRRHKVITAVAVRSQDCLREKVVQTQVRLKQLTETEIDGYIASDDWRGKAGGYAIQGPAAAFVPWIEGSFSAVVGLPLSETAALLGSAGFPLWSHP
ncbi:Maf family protein [Palleronia abyssalis]|uniref:dTTP/UTP pyrophosphatase n=1 Tax=Palleronia abyssalis TaxID=1501240 RepID=A0A2R8C1X8_9RHOB|nr:Maf family protein [Palleronia abyssalis]SPJ26424.1 Maf-like protein YhdE [Palleronia abyssalis]